MLFKKSFYLFFILLIIFSLFSLFNCFKGICEIIKLVDVGEVSSNDCSNIPNAVKRLDRCCIDLNCKMMGMIDVGKDNNGNCEGDAQYINHYCCDIPPCEKNNMEDVGVGMEGVCDGEETKYIDGRCCINKKIPTTTTTTITTTITITTTKPSTTTPLGLYVNGHFYMNCLNKKSNDFCQLNINRCMENGNRKRNWNRRWRINKKFMAFNCCYSCQKEFKDFLPTLLSNYNRNAEYRDNNNYDYNINDYNNEEYNDYEGYNNEWKRRNNYRGWG